MNNAVKFTEKGHVYINVSLENSLAGKPYIRFDVEDTGYGIKAKDQELIFDSFSQADYSSTRKHGGTGLGLAIAKQLITLLGGELTLISEGGKGSVFSLLVPVGMEIADQPLSDENNVAAHSDKDELSEFHGHILVAEDIKPSQVLIKTILNRMGIKVTVVEEGRVAVEMAQGS